MAKVVRARAKVKSIRPTEQPDNATGTAVMEPETPFDGPGEAAQAEPAPSPAPRRGKPAAGAPPKLLTFFQKLAGIAPEDWGTRAKVRVYRLAPIIDRLRGSDTKFVTAYEEMVDENRIKHDWGSGRYRLYLNFKMPTEGEKELDSVEIDIMDMKYPPNIPPGEWVNDSRNKQWEWARATFPAAPAAAVAAAQQPATNGVHDFVEVLRATNEMRREIREDMAPAAPPPTVAPAVAPASDPFDVVAKIMAMRTNDPMVALLMARMEAQDRAAEAARQREYELQRELRQSQTAPAATAAAAAPKSLLDQLNELAGVTDVIDKLKGGGGAVARPGKWGWIDGVKEVFEVAQPFLQPIGDGLGQLLAARANPAPANGQPPQARVQQQPAAGANDNVLQFVSKAMFTHFDNADTGSEFAAWLYNGMPDEFDGFQVFKHPRLPNMQGADAIVTAFSYSKYWDAIKEREPQFRAFVAEFCAWVKPGAEDVEVVDPEPDQQPAEVVDFDQEQM